MEANEYQVAGNHYNNKPYQHWDFVIDTRQPYVIGCATKYLSRWREKNGAVDLRKSLHYIAKASERCIGVTGYDQRFVDRFVNQLTLVDGEIIQAVMKCQFDKARHMIDMLISDEESTTFNNGAGI